LQFFALCIRNLLTNWLALLKASSVGGERAHQDRNAVARIFGALFRLGELVLQRCNWLTYGSIWNAICVADGGQRQAPHRGG
jgi:hypothetical protein